MTRAFSLRQNVHLTEPMQLAERRVSRGSRCKQLTAAISSLILARPFVLHQAWTQFAEVCGCAPATALCRVNSCGQRLRDAPIPVCPWNRRLAPVTRCAVRITPVAAGSEIAGECGVGVELPGSILPGCASGEMADTPDLGSGPARGGGSSPLSRTNFLRIRKFLFCSRRVPENLAATISTGAPYATNC